MKSTLYSFFGGAFGFLGVIAAFVAGGLRFESILPIPISGAAPRVGSSQYYSGFAVLAGIWPLHTGAERATWLARSCSMSLAGIVMKLGAYAASRVAMNLFPMVSHFGATLFVVLVWSGSSMAAAAALRQRDLKFAIGYSSVSHMAFV